MTIPKIFKRGISEINAISAIRRGLLKIVPFLLTGSFALMLRSLPIKPYNEFIFSFANGFFSEIFLLVYNATFGIMSVLMLISISYCYAQEHDYKHIGGTILSSMACFVTLIGVGTAQFDMSALGVKGIFTAILSALLATKIHIVIYRNLKRRRKYVTEGADWEFNESISMLLPTVITILIFVILNYAVIQLFEVESFYALFVKAANSLFSNITNTGVSGLLFIFISTLFWFFGLHGNNILESVAETQFAPLIDINIAAVAMGEQPTEIVTKVFFDCFVYMGGCGSTICLLIALLLFSKRKSNRRLSQLAAFPMLFNINEIMVFGLPIIFNPIMFIPFILTPIFNYLTSFFAMQIGLVPLAMNAVEWTTPVLMSGYLATGSINGIFLQLFNIICGMLIYLPFVRMYDKKKEAVTHGYLDEMVESVKSFEDGEKSQDLLQMDDAIGETAKYLASELENAINTDKLKLYYQPQFNKDMKIIGAEALLRWIHPTLGLIYPPLVIKLAKEADLLTKLEKKVIAIGLNDISKINESREDKLHVCINVTAHSLNREEYTKYLFESALRSEDIKTGRVCLEMTEQMTLSMNEKNDVLLGELITSGYTFAIDDFSMGSTSVKYLQSGKFGRVKIDGGLVKGIIKNPRNKEIIKAIVEMSKTLGFDVIAEYVETKEQMDALYEIGNKHYQGYLCSPAVPLEDFTKLLDDNSSPANGDKKD